MDIIAILITVAVMTLLGTLLGLLLALAGKIFEVKKDEREEKIIAALPGANCGGCGFTGCEDYARAVTQGKAEVNLCSVGGDEVQDAVSLIMGVNAEKKKRMRAQVMCSGTLSAAKIKYDYVGLDDCLSVAKLGNGPRECSYGCIGLGTCVHSCPFGAIKVENGVAVVEYEKCRACGICVNSCPQNLISLVPFESEIWVGCSSKDKGAVVRLYCELGCIGCGICKKACPEDAIELDGNIAKIISDKCVGCGICVEKCPRKIIWSGKKQTTDGDTINPNGEVAANDISGK